MRIKLLKDRLLVKPILNRRYGLVSALKKNRLEYGILEAKGRGKVSDSVEVGDVVVFRRTMTTYTIVGKSVIVWGFDAWAVIRNGRPVPVGGAVAVQMDPPLDAVDPESGLWRHPDGLARPPTGTTHDGRRVMWNTRARPQKRLSIHGVAWALVEADALLLHLDCAETVL
jgi:hypothetical protein